MFSVLPTSLLALLLASPAFSAPSTPNDPFHDITIHAPKRPEEPICCLRPLAPLEPTEDEDILLSFEDWKAKQLAETKEQGAGQPVGRTHATENLSESSVALSDSANAPTQAQGIVSVDVQETVVSQERLAPHLSIPLTDRFNYASLDCSARVHAAHKSAQSASSILSFKKDRYMLSPCAEEKQFVVVELCEDIRIDTVQLANYEFFSGVFKDFSVSVAKTYTTNPEEWTFAGTYRASNVRGVQSFHPPPTLRDFYRYIRIDFLSHYGSEYYCPVSLLRVYGLTHLEEWQWENWEAEARAKRSAEEASPPIEIIVDPPTPIPAPIAEDETVSLEIDATSRPDPVATEILDSLQYNVSTERAQSEISTTKTSEVSAQDPPRPHSDTLYTTSVSLSHSPSHAHSTTPDNHPSSSSVFIDSESSHANRSASPNSSVATISPSYVPPSPPVSSGGESIYRTIMNRLTALEANTTLYARYVEEQTAGMREVLRRLTEDIGRLEGIGRAQAQLYQRSVVELEKQTRRLEYEQRELLSRVNLLTDEVVLEKRLGIAQLCLLLTVLVFMALTRGSRGEHAYPRDARGSMREWGRRTLSLSGELMNRIRARSSTPPRAVSGEKLGGNDITFPSMDQPPDEQPRVRRSHAATSRKTLARPHTPTIRTPTSRHFVGLHHRVGGVPLSPSHHLGARPVIQRSSSSSFAQGFGGIGPVPKSAKRWARSAHLHEVKRGGEATPVPPLARNELEAEGDDAGVQVLLVPAAISRSETVTLGKGKGRMVTGSVRQPSPLRPAAVIQVDLSSPPVGARQRERRYMQSEGEASESETWVDTDVDGSECDSVGDGALEPVRERTYTAPSGSASNRSL